MKPGKHNIKFLLERRRDNEGEIITINVPLNMDVTFNGKRLRYFTNYRINADQWLPDKQKVKINNFNKEGQSATEINQRLISLSSTVSDIFRRFENDNKFPTVEQLREEIRTRLNEKINHNVRKETSFFERFEQYVEEAEVSPLRRRHLKSTMNQVKRFNDKLAFETFNVDKFKKYLQADKDSPKSLNTISGILKRVKSFYSFARIKEWTAENPFKDYTIDSEKYGDPIYLTKEERDALFDAKIENERLARVRDMFMLQCLIGARIADFIKLKKEHIVNGAIEYVPAKTVNKSYRKVRVPLGEKAKAIIAKYNIPDGSLVPYMTDQKYNLYLKELFRECKLNRPVIRLNPLTRKNEVKLLSDLASSHMARRTFIGLLHKTTKNEVISSMSGHVNDSKAFARYYKIDEETQEEAIKTID